MSEHKHGHYTKTKHPSKIRQLAADIKAGKVKYLHVSVHVKAGDALNPPMRTPIGKGATARKPPKPKVRVGQQRRAQQRLMRAAQEELNRAA